MRSWGRLTAIETHYNGYRFRSRLEARHAVFFDSLGIQYVYEPEGFALEGEKYLPDFWLPDYKYFIEIKGRKLEPGELEYKKIAALSNVSGLPVFYSVGDIWFPSGVKDLHELRNYYIPVHPEIEPRRPSWTPCLECGRLDFRYPQSPNISPHWWVVCSECGKTDLLSLGKCRCKQNGLMSDKLIQAYRAARSARFEHGELPGKTRRRRRRRKPTAKKSKS